MPTYEYECLKCHHRLEVFQKISEPPLGECPRCKGKLKKLISCGSGLIFKGSGFYITDYKKNKTQDNKEKTQHKKEEKNRNQK
jgi:putative FmdB family regulatory protein